MSESIERLAYWTSLIKQTKSEGLEPDPLIDTTTIHQRQTYVTIDNELSRLERTVGMALKDDETTVMLDREDTLKVTERLNALSMSLYTSLQTEPVEDTKPVTLENRPILNRRLRSKALRTVQAIAVEQDWKVSVTNQPTIHIVVASRRWLVRTPSNPSQGVTETHNIDLDHLTILSSINGQPYVTRYEAKGQTGNDVFAFINRAEEILKDKRTKHGEIVGNPFAKEETTIVTGSLADATRLEAIVAYAKGFGWDRKADALHYTDIPHRRWMEESRGTSLVKEINNGLVTLTIGALHNTQTDGWRYGPAKLLWEPLSMYQTDKAHADTIPMPRTGDELATYVSTLEKWITPTYWSI